MAFGCPTEDRMNFAPNHEISSVQAYMANCISGLLSAMMRSAFVNSVQTCPEMSSNFLSS